MNDPSQKTFEPRFVAQAVEALDGDGFNAMWGAYGRAPEYVMDNGEIEVFSTAEDAENKARKVMIESMNMTIRHTNIARPNSDGTVEEVKPIKMTNAELSAALEEADISANELSYLWGTRQSRVVKWIEGGDDVPFPLRWAIALLGIGDNYEIAMDIVAKHVRADPRKPANPPATAD